VLEGVEDHMVDGGLGREGDGHSDGRDVLGVSLELLDDGVFSDGEDLSGVNLTVIEDLLDLHLVLKRSDLELLEEGSLTGGDLVTLLDNLNGVDNLDLTLDNLGLNVQSLEERGLLGIHTGRTSGDSYGSRGENTNLSGGTSNLGVNNLLDDTEVTVGEDKTGVEEELVVDDLEVGAALLLLGVLFLHISDSLLHEGVLAHAQNGVNLSERFTHNANLLGGDVINVHKHAFGEFLTAFLSGSPDLVFSILLARFSHCN